MKSYFGVGRVIKTKSEHSQSSSSLSFSPAVKASETIRTTTATMRKSRHSLSSAICPSGKWLTLAKVRSQIFSNYATRLIPFLPTSQCYFVVRSKVDQCDLEMWKYPTNYGGYDNLAMMITRILRSFPKSEQTPGCQDSVFCLLNQCLDFQRGPSASSTSITWEPVRNAQSRAPP